MCDSQTKIEEKKLERVGAHAWHVSVLLVPEPKKDLKEFRFLNLQLSLVENSGHGQNFEGWQLHPLIQERPWENTNNTFGARYSNRGSLSYVMNSPLSPFLSLLWCSSGEWMVEWHNKGKKQQGSIEVFLSRSNVYVVIAQSAFSCAHLQSPNHAMFPTTPARRSSPTKGSWALG